MALGRCVGCVCVSLLRRGCQSASVGVEWEQNALSMTILSLKTELLVLIVMLHIMWLFVCFVFRCNGTSLKSTRRIVLCCVVSCLVAYLLPLPHSPTDRAAALLCAADADAQRHQRGLHHAVPRQAAAESAVRRDAGSCVGRAGGGSDDGGGRGRRGDDRAGIAVGLSNFLILLLILQY
jgi:hypothetical protein